MAGHKGQVVGYVRVSAVDQNEVRQVEALGEVDRLFAEKVSGKDVVGRPQLQELLAYVRDGDVIRVKSPDRLSRSTRDLLDMVETSRQAGHQVTVTGSPGTAPSVPLSRLPSWPC